MRSKVRRLGLLTKSVMLTTFAVLAMGVVLWGSRTGHAATEADLVHVDGTSGTDSETCGAVDSPCRTIQYAIASRVDAGDVVSVAAGTYVEQVVITKALTLQGAGSETLIQSPDPLTASFSAGAAENYPIVFVKQTDEVTIQDLVVDGAGKGEGNYRFVGVGYHNAGGTVTGVEIKDVRETPFSGAQHGVGLFVYNNDGTSRSVAVTNCDIHGFQKNGLALNAGPTTTLTVDVQGNLITGQGATTVTAQNGIQVWAEQGTGAIASNTVEQIAYDNAEDPANLSAATSILNGHADLDIVGNTVREGHLGIYNIDGAGEISGNVLEIEKVGVFGFGVIASDPPRAIPSPFAEGAPGGQQEDGLTPQRAASVLDVVVSGNHVALSGSDSADTVGIEADAGYGPNDLAFTARGNAVTGFGVGIKTWQCESDCDAGTFTELEARYNRIVGNDTGLLSNVDYLGVDAMNNWWGCNEGPSAAPGDCDTVSGLVDANPWLVLRLTADPDLVIVEGGTSDLTADLRYNSSGFDTSPQGHVPDGTTVAFAATLGTATPVSTSTVGGLARSTFTAGSVPGLAAVSATVDNETVATEMRVEQVELVIEKTDGVETARPGDILTYTLTITNDSLLNATGVVVTDTLPVSTTYVGGSDWHPTGDAGVYTQSVGGLTAGESTVLSIAVRLDETVPAGFGSITNTAQVADDGTHGPQATAEDDDVDLVIVPPDLAVAKENAVEVVEPGQVLTYTLTVSNIGRQDAAGVVLTDTLPDHTSLITATPPFTLSSANRVVTWGLSDLPMGESVTRTVVVQAADPPWPAGVEAITNTAVVADDGTYGADLDVTDNIARDVDPVDADPDLLIFKDDDEPAAALGEVTSYILTYLNRGNQTTQGVVITETVPAETTFAPGASTPGWRQVGATDVYTLEVGTLAPGSGNIAIFAVRVNDTLSAGVTTIENEAVIGDDGTSGADRNLGNNRDDDVNSVSGAPDLTVSKDDDLARVKPEDLVTYTLTVSNVGTQGATGVTVTDTLPMHTSFITASHGGALFGGVVTWPSFQLAAPGSTTRTVTVQLPAAIPAGMEAITNTASVRDDGSNGADLDPSNNAAQHVATVEAAPILAVSKDDGRLEVAPGEILTYTLTVKNVGDQNAGGIVLSDTLPAHTDFVRASDGGALVDGVVVWPSFDLAVDASVGRQLTVRVDRSLPSGVEAITNTAEAVAPGGVSDSGKDVDALVREPNLVVTKDDGRQSANPDDELTYVIVVTNVGTVEATGVVITDTLPDHTVFVDASPGFTPASPDDEVAWPAFDLAAGEAVTRTVTVRVEAELPSSVATITNRVIVVGDGDLSASDSDVDLVVAAPDLQVSKTDGRTDVRAGEMLTYTLTVDNVGTQPATGVELTDTLPDHTTFQAASHGGTVASGIVTWPDFTMAVGAVETRTVTVWVSDPWPSGAEPVLINTAAVTDDGANGDDPVMENNEDTDTTDVWPHQIFLPLISKQ